MDINLISFETSGTRCGVALLRADRVCVHSIAMRSHEGGQEHGQRILPLASELLREAGLRASDLHGVAFGQGPGGFTGLRVACGVTQGMAYALGLPVFPVVSNLAVAAASGAAPGQLVLAALDARMDELYLAAYRAPVVAGGEWQTLSPPQLVGAADALPWAEHMLPAWRAEGDEILPPLWVGDGWTLCGADARFNAEALALKPDAAGVARLAYAALLRNEGLPAAQAAPLYVRDKVAFTIAERERGDGGNPRARVPLTVAAMQSAHLDDVAALEARVQSNPWTRRNFEDALTAGYEAWVLYDGADLVGFYVAMLAPDVSHLLSIAVDPLRQRQGWGRHLLAHHAAQAAGRGLEGVLLEVRPSNEGALVLYRRFGYEQIGVRKGYYPAAHGREDAWVFQKRLASSASAAGVPASGIPAAGIPGASA